jgi:hypothetical protein
MRGVSKSIIDMLRFNIKRSAFASLSILLFASGCQAKSKPAKPAAPEEVAASQELSTGLTQIINDARIKYWPLRYEFAEDLLERLDQIESDLAGKKQGKAHRFLPNLDEVEEKAHFRETAQRWEAQTGKNFRTEIDRLKASVAARKPGERFHPEFQKDFSATFDDFIKIEVLEMRGRSNRVIHESAEKLFAKYRDGYPQLVLRFEAELKKPEYALPGEAR